MTQDNRISEIRAELDLSATQLVSNWDNYTELYEWADNERSRRIRAILDRPGPVPRVFFPGDIVPAGVLVAQTAGPFSNPEYVVKTGTGPWVEVPLLSEEEFRAVVDRASEERATEGGQP